MMRLTWRRDGLATLLVATAAVLYVLWLTGTSLTGTSTRVLGAAVFALGWAACSGNKAEMAIVYGVDHERRRPPMLYVVTASIVGFVALVAGVITLVSANEAMLATLVVAMAALWAIATSRHAIAPTEHAPQEIPEQLQKAA
jgi:hypothetical protein